MQRTSRKPIAISRVCFRNLQQFNLHVSSFWGFLLYQARTLSLDRALPEDMTTWRNKLLELEEYAFYSDEYVHFNKKDVIFAGHFGLDGSIDFSWQQQGFFDMGDFSFLSWCRGTRMGEYISTRSRYYFRKRKDHARREKVAKEFEKARSKYLHRVKASQKLVEGKRKKPQKEHIVYRK